jgi:histidinol-phosphate/aromatic aminotransferase/cobyric acid decarboxylase-like protein
MEFRLSEQQEMIRQMAADFAANEIVPYCADWDHRREVPLGTLAKMQELGFMTIGVPLEYGGDGLDNTSQCLVCEEIAKGDAGMATTIVASTILASAPILVGANHEQKKWWYGRHLDGAVCGFCLTEPSAGSDALSISTRCIKDGDHYIINGTKQFITNGGIAMQFSVMATLDFQPHLEEFQDKISPKTKAVIINSPNNPTGVIYSEATIIKLASILRAKQKEFNSHIYLISDEPYRELAYDNIEVPYLTKYYENTIVAYSFSKSLSLPGERIGYLLIPPSVSDYENVLAASNIATRILGFVNAPSLFQRVIARCLEAKVDIDTYNRNRELLYQSLLSFGYECIKPQGAFYLFVKTPIEDDLEFCQRAKQKKILLVPGTSFGCPGYVRIAYCVAYQTIENALPGFKELINECK